MTIHLTKLRFGALLLAVALFAPSAAWATHVFIDVPDTSTFAADIGWASTNGITSGRDGVHFEPGINVTRQESVAFLKRYHDNIVKPALDNTYTKTQTDAAIAASTTTVLWAMFDKDGAYDGGMSGITATKTSTGQYTVDFNGADITACGWSAIHRLNPGLITSGIQYDFMISLQQASIALTPIVDQIIVRTSDGAGASANAPFQIMAVC